MGYNLQKHARRSATYDLAEAYRSYNPDRDPSAIDHIETVTTDVAQPHQDGLQSWTRVTVDVTPDMREAAIQLGDAIDRDERPSLSHGSDGRLEVSS